MAPLSAFCFILIATGILWHAIMQGGTNPFALVIPVFVILSTVSYLLWFGIHKHEDRQFASIVQMDADNLQADIERHLQELYNALQRLDWRWERQGGTPEDQWRSDALAYVDSFPYIEALEWVDSAGYVRWIVSRRPVTHLEGVNLTKEKNRREAIYAARDTRQALTTPTIPLLWDRSEGYLYMTPLHIGDRFDGVIAAVFNVQSLITQTVSPHILESYFLVIHEGDNQIYTNLPDSAASASTLWKAEDTISNGSHIWRFTLIPKPATKTAHSSFLPLIAALVCEFMALLIALIVYLGIQRSNAMRALEQTSMFNQAILDNAPYTIIATNMQGEILLFNRTAEKELGYRAEEVVGKHTPLLWHDSREIAERAEELSAQWGEEIPPEFAIPAVALREGRETREWTVTRKNGSTYPVLLTLTALTDGNGHPVGLVGMMQDITERKEMDRIKSEFISVVSHELRTPLTSIRGSLGLIRGGATGDIPPKAKELVDIAYKNTERLILLINDILDIDKIESGQMRFEMRNESVNSLLKQAIESNQAYADKYGVQLELEALEPDAAIHVDGNRLMQVLSNLLSNAAKFAPADSQVTLSALRRDGHIRICVTDRGPGIPEEFRSRIFNKFAQADASSSRQKGGTGLGLHISRKIIAQMGGAIGFDTQMGTGTTFWIDLPEIPVSATAEMALDLEEELPALCTLPLLLCTPEAGLGNTLSTMLESAGYPVDCVHNLEQAKHLLSSQAYQAALLDLSFPNAAALRLVRQLRQDTKTESLPIIVIYTGADTDKRPLASEALHIAGWLTTPVDRDSLQKALNQAAVMVGKRQIRILHVEDDADLSHVIAQALEGKAELATAPTLRDATRLLEQEEFDLVILDLGLPDGSGAQLLERFPSLRDKTLPVLILSANEPDAELRDRVASALVKARVSESSIVDTVMNIIRQTSIYQIRST